MRTHHPTPDPRRLRRTAVLVLTVALLAAACGDDDDDVGTDDPLEADLEVVVSDGTETIRTGTVRCGAEAAGTGFLEGGAEAACELMAGDAVRGILVGPPPEDEVCTEIYGGPGIATISGTIDGEPVDRTVTRTNGCEIARWDALVPLIGEPVPLPE